MEEEEEKKLDPNSWALPFGDMITLLMTFFILIISMSTIKMEDIAEKMNKSEGTGDNLVSAELRESGLFNEEVMSKVKIMIEKDELPKPADDIESVRDALVVFITENKLTKIIDLIKTREGFSIRIRADILFDPGKAIIKKEYLFLLNNISELLSSITNSVRIDGHTDKSNPDEYYNNKLSIARATNICNHLIGESLLSPARFAIAGHGSYQPLLPNNNDNNRAKNRRVEIIIRKLPKNG